MREHGGGDAASRAASTQPQSLLGRVQLLESAMATLLEAQVRCHTLACRRTWRSGSRLHKRWCT